MLNWIVGVISNVAGDAGDVAVGSWADISFTSNFGGSRTTASTITFTSTGSRTFTVTHNINYGSLSVQIDSGGYVSISSGGTFVITSGQTVTFKYSSFYISESATVTIKDNLTATNIDSFTCDFGYTGTPF